MNSSDNPSEAKWSSQGILGVERSHKWNTPCTIHSEAAKRLKLYLGKNTKDPDPLTK